MSSHERGETGEFGRAQGGELLLSFQLTQGVQRCFQELLVKLEEAARNYKKMERRLADANQFLSDLRKKAHSACQVDQESRTFTDHDVAMDCLRISTF